MNKNIETKKNNAASVLVDEVMDVFEKLNKAMGLMQEVTIEYFHRYDRVNKEDHEAIVCDFNRAALYASVVEDYVFEAKKLVMELVARSQNNIADEEVQDGKS